MKKRSSSLQTPADEAAKKESHCERELLVGEDRADAAATRVFAHDLVWPDTTQEGCLYDLHPFSGTPFGIPRSFDRRTGRYHVQGFFCSLRCAREYLIRQRPKDTELFDRFCRSVYHVDSRHIPRCAPLDQLAAMLATAPVAVAVGMWRQIPYTDGVKVRETAGLFIRVAQAYEENLIREQKRIKHEHQLDLLHSRPVPIVLTAKGHQEQIKYVERKLTKTRAEPPATGGGIESLMKLKRKETK